MTRIRTIRGGPQSRLRAGVDIVSNRESSEITHAAHVKDHYTGFAGDDPCKSPSDLKHFPGCTERLANNGRTPKNTCPMCAGRLYPTGQSKPERYIANLTALREGTARAADRL